ncbi:MAG: ABC transporter substrate-binding protein [Tissierellia bacterium]|nr:ABC transporter substrate-binding protein [Tissierellia bacterium]
MKKIIALLLLIFTLTACAPGGENSAAAPENASQNEVAQETAEVEGTITLYTSQPEEDANQLIEGFKELHPKADVVVFRSGTEEVVSKILSEKEVNAVQADVILVSDTVTFEILKANDLLEPYESPELEGLDPKFYDPDKFYAGTKIISTGIIQNTEVYPGEVKAFKDLISPETKSQTIMPSPLYSGAAAYNLSLITRTDGLGWAFYQGLKDNDILVDKGNGAVQKAVMEGQKGLGIIVDYMANRSKNEGAPVVFIYPEEGSPIVTEPVGIVKGTQNPEVAQAFYDYIISKEGQQLAADMGYTPIREDVEAPEGLKSAKDLQVLLGDDAVLLENREADKEEFSKVFN